MIENSHCGQWLYFGQLCNEAGGLSGETSVVQSRRASHTRQLWRQVHLHAHTCHTHILCPTSMHMTMHCMYMHCIPDMTRSIYDTLHSTHMAGITQHTYCILQSWYIPYNIHTLHSTHMHMPHGTHHPSYTWFNTQHNAHIYIHMHTIHVTLQPKHMSHMHNAHTTHVFTNMAYKHTTCHNYTYAQDMAKIGTHVYTT